MGAVLEIWAVDRAALERRLDDPDAHWDEALEKAASAPEIKMRVALIEGLAARKRGDWKKAYDAVIATIRASGRLCSDISVSSLAAADFADELDQAGLGALLGGAPYWMKPWSGDEPAFGFVAQDDLANVRATLSDKASSFEIVPAGPLDDALSEVEWLEKDLASIYL